MYFNQDLSFLYNENIVKLDLVRFMSLNTFIISTVAVIMNRKGIMDAHRKNIV